MLQRVQAIRAVNGRLQILPGMRISLISSKCSFYKQIGSIMLVPVTRPSKRVPFSGSFFMNRR